MGNKHTIKSNSPIKALTNSMWGLMLMTAGAWQEMVWFSKQVMPCQNILSLICELSEIRPWTSHWRFNNYIKNTHRLEATTYHLKLNTIQSPFIRQTNDLVKTLHLTPLVPPCRFSLREASCLQRQRRS